MEQLHDFTLEQTAGVTYACTAELEGMYKLSPFVWREIDHYELLLRVVNYSDTPSEKVARIHRGVHWTVLLFALGAEPVIAPGDDVAGSVDSGGCEDPTVAFFAGQYYVYYTGWNEHIKRGELLLASGPIFSIWSSGASRYLQPPAERIRKRPKSCKRDDGSWRLFFEYADDDRSKIGSRKLRSWTAHGRFKSRSSKHARVGIPGTSAPVRSSARVRHCR